MNTTPMNTTTEPSPSSPRGGAAPRNRYYVCLGHSDTPIPWNPHARDVDEMHADYFGGVFVAMEQRLNADGLTVYLTFRLDELPSYGPDVVAVIMDDELGRVPAYANRVRAVFKTMGMDFPFEATPFRTPLDLTLLTAVKYARTQVLRAPGFWNAWREGGPDWYGGEATPIFAVPIGYVNQDPLPIKPLDERAYDLFFSGSITNQRFPWYSPQRWLRTPKEVARARMVRALRHLQARRPDLNLLIDTWASFVPHETQHERAEESYSEMMMNTRICPVPRGTRLESARLYEALRYGCVLITEPLPDRWFLRDLPHIVVHDWADLPAVAEDLLRTPDRLQALHAASLRWWDAACSEEAVGRYMAEQLNAAEHRMKPPASAPPRLAEAASRTPASDAAPSAAPTSLPVA
jgi:hypothetical protein